MGVARVSKYDQKRHYRFPIFGNSADVKVGAFLKRGTTAETDLGTLMKASGTSAQPDILAILSELHDFSDTGDALVDGTTFVTHDCELVVPTRVLQLEYDKDSKIDATQAVNSTTITITSLENNIDTAFLYVTAGTGAGQTNFLTASASGSATLKAAFGTNLDTTSDLIKILPRFHQVIGLNSDGTKLSSQAAAGSVTGLVLDNFIQRGGGSLEQLDWTKHDALKGLPTRTKFYSDLVLRNTAIYTID